MPDHLRARLAHDPGRPFVTAYDETTGERTELSVTTYANWVAKTANLLVEEYLLDPGDTLRIALPTHWLGTVFLGAAWAAGLVVTTDPEVAADLIVCGPDAVEASGPLLACSLRPFAVRFPGGPPEGADDYGALWPGQADVFVPVDPPQPGTAAWNDGERTLSQGELLACARTSGAPWAGGRLLTDVAPTAEAGTTTLLPALVTGGSLVLVSGAADAQWPARHEDERATEVLRSLPG